MTWTAQDQAQGYAAAVKMTDTISGHTRTCYFDMRGPAPPNGFSCGDRTMKLSGRYWWAGRAVPMSVDSPWRSQKKKMSFQGVLGFYLVPGGFFPTSLPSTQLLHGGAISVP